MPFILAEKVSAKSFIYLKRKLVMFVEFKGGEEPIGR